MVTFRLSSRPSTRAGCRPSRSTAIASSVTTIPAACALPSARCSTSRRNACGVSARQRRSRGSVAAMCPLAAARLSVSRTGAARIAPSAQAVAASSKLPMSPARRFGRAASCTSSKASSATPSGKARSAASTESARSPPPMQVRTGLPCSDVQPGQCGSPSASATTAPAMRGWASSASSAWPINGFPAACKYCLGTSPPNRRPRPAAGTSAQLMASHRPRWPRAPQRQMQGPRAPAHHR